MWVKFEKKQRDWDFSKLKNIEIFDSREKFSDEIGVSIFDENINELIDSFFKEMENDA
jgi:hypothetical protein